ncbi:sel1 repeat family protein [Candidatus Odyssella thessalonicensis]|uniref:sel1 repeat family protein n=1 Tax=Candidatus Odyssella thessalonicensis TaxID=84647 RepID=UPI000225B4F7|nr:sel1 repeat family protein [Candidatus Odyssella thessalonicensis]
MRKILRILALPLLGLCMFSPLSSANDYLSEMPPEMMCRISAELYLQDICSLELVCHKLASILQESYQYKAILRDYTPANPLDSPPLLTSKKAFLYYKEHSSEFRYHLGTLWKFYFPASPALDFGLTYYWGSHLSSNDLRKIRATYLSKHIGEVFERLKESHPHNPISSEVEKEALSAMSKSPVITLKEIRERIERATMMRRGEGLPNPDYITAREEYTAISALKLNLEPEAEAEVYWQLAEMDRRGEGINAPDWGAARLGYLRILRSPGADSGKKVLALTTLAEMDYQGHGLCRPDYTAARDKALTALAIPNALPEEVVKEARELLAKLDQHQTRIRDVEDLYTKDREHYIWVINSSSALPEAKIMAQFKLAEMDYYGQGIEAPDYAAARQGYRCVIALPFVGGNLQKINAQFKLAKMDYYGEGIEMPDYLSAREGCTIMLNSSFDLPEEKIMAQFLLAEMDYHGDKIGAPNYTDAYASYKDVINSSHTPDLIRVCAQLKLAQMYHYGQGIPRPNYAEACDIYRAVINSSQASAPIRETARKELVLADILRIRKN